MNRSEAVAAGLVLTILEKRPSLQCEPEYGALVCLTRNNGFPRSRIVRDLNVRHSLTIDLYRPSDESAPIEGLKMRPGYACIGCGHKTTSEEIARGHLKCGQVRRAHLQCWNTSGDGAYWIVTPPPAAATATINGSFFSEADMFLLRFT